MHARLRLQRVRRHAAGPALRSAAEKPYEVTWSEHVVTLSYDDTLGRDAFGLRRGMHR